MTTTHFSTHSILIDDNIGWVTIRGAASRSDIETLVELVTPVLAQVGYLILVCDVSQAGALDAEGRRFMSTWFTRVTVQFIFIRAGTVPRTIITMVDRIGQLLGRDRQRSIFVNSEGEARELIPSLRAELALRAARRTA